MGPWPLSHGMGGGGGGSGGADSGFNGAVASQPRNGDTCCRLPRGLPPLQWGRGLSATEWRGQAWQLAAFGWASMGPWPLSHGMRRRRYKPPSGWGAFNGAVASQPRNGRNRVLPMAARELLQWGRGLSATEWRTCRGSAPPSCGPSMGPWPLSHGMTRALQNAIKETFLQWGRGLSATE